MRVFAGARRLVSQTIHDCRHYRWPGAPAVAFTTVSTPPRIRLAPIKREATAPIVPLLNTPAPVVAVPVVRRNFGVPVPATPRSPFAPLVPPPQVTAAPEPEEISAPSVPDATTSTSEAPAETDEVAMTEQPALPMLSVAPLVAAAVAPTATAPVADETVSAALLAPSAAPATIRATSVVLKWGIIGTVLLAVGFFALRFAIPFLNELRKPKEAIVVVDKEASTAVRALQATRQVVAKNDAKVNYLNEVVAAGETKPAEAKTMPPPATPVSATVTVPQDGLSAFHEAVGRFKIDSVVRGTVVRANIDGLIVKQGDIVNRTLGLRFSGVDDNEHALLFTNADNVVFKKYY